MPNVKLSPIGSSLVLGEAPHWIEKDQSLVFVDVTSSNMYRYYTETERLQKLHVEGATGVSFVIPIEGKEDEFAIGVGQSVSSVTWSPDDPEVTAKKPMPLARVTEDANLRLNDGKCDPRGRLWAGTMGIDPSSVEFPQHTASLYSVDSNFKVNEMEKKVSLSNGLAWDEGKNTLYYIDTLKFSVDAFDYNDHTGDIANRKVVLDFKELGLGGLPDGMAIDINGHLWVACFDGWKILQIDPKVGKVLQSVKFPACNITSCCFGGPDYSTLYVTSATLRRSPEELQAYPDSGKTFAVTGLNTKGMAPVNYHVDLTVLDQLRKH